MIEVSNLSKKFQLTKEAKKQLAQNNADVRQDGNVFNALANVSFSCPSGQVLGLLGPNGAGKTTTLRILASSLIPDSGDIIINGESVLNKPLLAKRKIGFLSSKTGLYARLTAKENIEYFAKLHGMNKKTIEEFGEPLYQQLGIESYLHRRVDTLSSGMYQKISIARAVIHQPDVLVLDEPTTGLDIMATETVLSFIKEQRDLGRPVIFSTHHLDEVSFLADKIAIIDQGKTCFEGSVEQLQEQASAADLREAFMSVLVLSKRTSSNQSSNKEVN